MQGLEIGINLEESKVYDKKHSNETTIDYVKRNYAFYYISSVLVESIDHYIAKQDQLIDDSIKQQKARRDLIVFNIAIFIMLVLGMYLSSKIVEALYNPANLTEWSFIWQWLLLVLGGLIIGSYIPSFINKDSNKFALKKITSLNKYEGTITFLIAMAVQIVVSYVLMYDKNAMAYPPFIYFIITFSIALIVYSIAKSRIDDVYNVIEGSLYNYTVVLIPTLGGLITMGALYQTSLLYSIMVLLFPFIALAIIAIIGFFIQQNSR
jgi:hypothetical protein